MPSRSLPSRRHALNAEEMVAKKLIIVGRVLAPRGLAGEIRVEAHSDAPGRFSPGGVLHVRDHPHKIEHSTSLPKGVLALKLEGVENHKEAESLRGALLLVPEDMISPLPEGEYYHFQIIDLKVYSQEKEYLGLVTEILSTGSNDVYVVSEGGKELLIPAVDEVIKEVDVARGTMTVDLPEGLRPGRESQDPGGGR